MTAQQPSTPGTPHPEESPRKIDLNVTQVSAAALAALTAAVLGSTIGVAGTVIGAALASIITTVSSTLYLHSLERSRERVRLLTARTRPLPRQRAGPDVPQLDVPQPDVPQAPTAALEDVQVQPRTVLGSATARPRRTVRWAATAAGSVAAFALAMTVITGVEGVTGQALSGGSTPTVPVVFGGGQRTTPEPVPAPETSTAPSEAPEPTSSPEATSTSEPQESPSTGARPTGTPAPTDALPTDARPTGTPTADKGRPVVPLPTP